MTKQDFELIAKVIARNKPSAFVADPDPEGIWVSILGDMADTLERHNVRFNKALFIKACFQD